MVMRRILIILRDAFPDFRCSDTNDRIGRRIVVGVVAKILVPSVRSLIFSKSPASVCATTNRRKYVRRRL